MAYVLAALGDDAREWSLNHDDSRRSIDHLCALGQLIADLDDREMRLSVDGMTVETFVPLGEHGVGSRIDPAYILCALGASKR
jgi:hypothetical protein